MANINFCHLFKYKKYHDYNDYNEININSSEYDSDYMK